MNANRPSEENAALDKVLGEWKVNATLPPRFEEQVWQRLAKSEAQPEPATGVGLWRLLESIVPRPRFALAYMAILLAAGLAAGSWAAQAKTNRLDSELSLRYVQSIDPYRAEAPLP